MGPDSGSAPVHQVEDRPLYSRVGNTLRAGLWVSTGVMLVGLILTALAGRSQAREVLPLDRIGPHIRSGDPAVVLDLGILLLFATPLVGVLVALWDFVSRRDRVFGGLTLALLIILVAGFVIALH